MSMYKNDTPVLRSNQRSPRTMLKSHSEKNPASDPAILWAGSTPRSFQPASKKMAGAATERCISMAHDEFLRCLASVPLFSNCTKRPLQKIAKVNLPAGKVAAGAPIPPRAANVQRLITWRRTDTLISPRSGPYERAKQVVDPEVVNARRSRAFFVQSSSRRSLR
jgi:hypothetical protein